ncbi:MAG: hypothetical protein QM731_20625 [Chitinophagaceae bacterium]
MKKLLVLSAIVLGSFIYTSANAQVKFSVNINIGSQPDWGPSGYNYAEYYYLPEIDAYYYIPKKQFIYQDRGSWIFANSLPSRFHNFDLYRSYKVVVNEPKPYNNNRMYQSKYGQFRNDHNQRVIRDNNRYDDRNVNSRPVSRDDKRDMPQRGNDQHNDRNKGGRFGK